MKKQGAVIVDPANITTLGKFDDTENDVLQFEFKADLNKYLAWLGPARAGAFVEGRHRVQRRAQRRRNARTSHRRSCSSPRKRGPLTSAPYKAALAKNHLLSRTLGIDAVMTKNKLDALSRRRAARRGYRPRQRRWRHRRRRGAVHGHISRRLSAHYGARRVSSTVCLSGCRSSAVRGASRRSSSSPMRTSRRPDIVVRRTFAATADLSQTWTLNSSFDRLRRALMVSVSNHACSAVSALIVVTT